jgi:hypothetical protein
MRELIEHYVYKSVSNEFLNVNKIYFLVCTVIYDEIHLKFTGASREIRPYCTDAHLNEICSKSFTLDPQVPDFIEIRWVSEMK